MSAKFTVVSIQRLRPGTHWDASTPAFGLRVGKRARTFIAVKDGGRRVTIGRYPAMSLAAARKRAKGILLGVYDKSLGTGYIDAVERYLKQMVTELRPRTHYEYGLILRRFSFTTTAVTPSEVAGALEKIKKQSARSHHYTVLKVFFNWAVRQGYVDTNPLAKVRKPKVASARERALEDHELKAIWNACEALGKYGAMVRLLLVTGQRKSQFAALKEDWVDWKGRRFIFPAEAMKTNRVHVLPFSTLGDFVLRGVIPIGGYYFSPESALGQPFTAWSKNKAKLDSLLDLDHWTLHDLRRTWSTNAARLEIAPHITERVLSHVAPEGKVAAVYNRHRYENEMRDAMERMSTFVMNFISE